MRVKRLLSIGLSVIMMVTMLPVPSVQAQSQREGTARQEGQLLVHYDMTETNGKLVDVTGHGLDGTCVGLKSDNFVQEKDTKALNLTGDKSQYVKLPDGCIPGEEFTIEAKVKTDVRADHWIYCFGTKEEYWPNVKNYIFCNPNQAQGTLRMGLKDENTEMLCQQGSLKPAVYNTISATFKDGVMTVYLNGEKVEEIVHNYKISEILKNGVENKEDCIGYIGKSIYKPDPGFIGSISDFKIYDYARTAEELADGKIEDEPEDKPEEPKKTDAEVVAFTKEKLMIPNQSNIRGNITLPSTFDRATIEWKSSNEEVISTKVVENENYDPTPAGVVTRGENDVKVTLTATIRCGSETAEKAIDVTVKAKGKKLTSQDYGGYLFVHFTGESPQGEQIYFSLSKDGQHWNDLNDGEPVLISGLGEKGVRDPFVVRSPEGDKFYLIATDLRIASNKGWTVAQYGGSRALIIWESDDLVNWSEPRRVDVGIDTAGCVWAPEAVYDSKTGDYMVFWASMVKEDTDKEAKQRIYCSKTRDFVTFSEPQKYIERQNHVIDTTILESNGTYYRYSKDETTKRINVDASNQLLHTTFTPVQSDTLANLNGVEGPLIFKFNDSNKWCLMVDQYATGGGYLPLITEDLSSGAFKKLSQDEYSLGDNLKRHGTVLNLTNTEYEAIAKKWGTTEETRPVEEEQQNPVLSYDFEDTSTSGVIKDTSGNGRDGALAGNAAVTKDNTKNSNVLYLDGTKETYAAFPKGFFDGRDTMTISMDVKADTVSGNFFTLAIGKDTNKYMFLRTRDTQIRNAITKSSYGAEQEAVANTTESIKGKWMNLKIVLTKTSMAIYRDGELLSINNNKTVNMSNLGKDLLGYLGKSFYSADAYFKGWFDNVKVYNRALSEVEIASEFGKEVDSISDVQAEGYQCAKTMIDKKTHTITMCVSRANSTRKELGTSKVSFTMCNGAKVGTDNSAMLDLSKESKVQVVSQDGTARDWTVKAVLWNNSILGGLYADPDIDVFGDTYYIYPTTDGVKSWGGHEFHAFSSKDLIDWKDEGVIVDVATDQVPWAVGSAWAPTIEEKNGTYYFYFCAKREDGVSCIGVATSSTPKGPFKVMDAPLLTPEITKQAGIQMGQTIDPSVFTDEDGTSYLYFGNGNAAVVQLNEDMTSLKAGTMKNISGLKDFRESVVVIKHNGKYHFTWSCDDTGSENYHVNYGVADSPYGNVTYQYTLLQKYQEDGILGTGHQSFLKIPNKEEYYIAYHRFGMPLNQYASNEKGFNRETCLDKVTFGENGLMEPVNPSLTGITEKVIVQTATPTPQITVDQVTGLYAAGQTKNSVKLSWKEVQGAAGYQVVYQCDGRQKEMTTVGNNITLTGLSASSKIVARVRACKNVEGKEYFGEYSNYVTTATAPDKAVVMKVKATTSSIKLTWKGQKGVSGYEVMEGQAGKWRTVAKVDARIKAYTISKLKDGTDYQFKVRAVVNVNGRKLFGDWSTTQKVSTALKAPVVKSAKTKHRRAYVSWKKVNGASGYEVYQYNAKKKKYIKVAVLNKASKTTYCSGRYWRGTTVKYVIKAYKKSGKKVLYSPSSKGVKIRIR